MSSQKTAAAVAPTQYIGFAFNADRFSGKDLGKLRHELVDAQVEVLRMYLEKRSRERLVEALDKLIACAEASFRSEEALMECLTGRPDPLHCKAHRRVLMQLVSLRACAMDFDRGRLLAHLILVDRELTSHISDVVEAAHPGHEQDLANCGEAGLHA